VATSLVKLVDDIRVCYYFAEKNTKTTISQTWISQNKLYEY